MDHTWIWIFIEVRVQNGQMLLPEYKPVPSDRQQIAGLWNHLSVANGHRAGLKYLHRITPKVQVPAVDQIFGSLAYVLSFASKESADVALTYTCWGVGERRERG